jgi:hypothetical protein
MSSRIPLDEYIARARQRLEFILLSRGAALLAVALLALTLLAAVALRSFAFSETVVLVARAMFVLAAAVVGAYLWRQWRALQLDSGASALERALPAQSGRVQTYLQEQRKQPGSASVLLDLLAEDAQRVAEQEPLRESIPARRVWLPGVAAGAAIMALAALLWVAGSVGDGARRLWLGSVPPAARMAAAAGGIAVKPGDVSVRRNQDLPIAAIVASGNPEVHVRFGDSGEWETAPMDADGKGGFKFTLFAVREAARYYVTAGSLRSAEHRIDVVDLPQIESLRLTYNYPSWTGLAQRVEESGGDIRAVTGTRVALEVVTDVPIETPLLVINGAESGLDQRGVISRGGVSVKEPGHYRIATRFGNEIVPLTPDFVIDVVKDEKPTVEILRPGRDYQATNIEEVPVSLKAQDDFRLEALELRYSVNGGDWRTEKLSAGAPDIQAAALLRLEEMQQRGAGGAAPLLVPGDLVSYYASARDHGSSAQTDLFLIQIQPFDRRYTQSQANGGGGGGGGGEDDEGQISQRQREVLLATWNLSRNKENNSARESERAADSARMLSEVQKTLADQASTLVERAKARALTGGDDSVNSFVKSLEAAAKAMTPAVENLAKQDLPAAIQHEQQALQHLLRAEATFRDIQVAMRSPGGGGGGGAQAGRDVSEMTALELDLEKNQYETEPQQSAQQSGQAEDETMRRLRELARRQEQLARDAARNNTPAEAQRWQQEQLRREAEQLRQQLEQLAQQQAQQRGSQQGGSQQKGSQQNGRSQGQQSASQSSAGEAAQQVAEAIREMQARNSGSAANNASEQLNRARERLERGRSQQEQQQFESLSQSARELSERQRASEDELRAALSRRPPPSIANPRTQQGSGLSFEQAERLSSTKRELQADLDALQRQMQTARQQAGERAPKASERVGNAARELQESDTQGALARNARDIERGRGAQAATREGLITESLQQLQRGLDEAASVAATESGGRSNESRAAEPGDLLAELGDLRRALERARQQGVAQAGRNNGEAGTQSPDASEGQRGQDGGRSGEQGQGGQGQGGQTGGQPGQQGQQGGQNGGGDGGAGGDAFLGGGANRGGARVGPLVAGNRGRDGRDPAQIAERQALRAQTQLSGQRLAQLREQLRNGALADADVNALQELSGRLRRTGVDPMSSEYQRMVGLVNQLELAALKAERAANADTSTRAADMVDDARRYRDNVAEYYRKLGGKND